MTADEVEASSSAAPGDRRLGFLIAGVQKGGTTSLYRMLAEHPQVARAGSKELHFFDRDHRDWSNPDYERYHAKITWHPSATIAGEATPIYVFWPGAMERIRAYNPDMRIVLSFRDPIERAFSQWSMEKDRRGVFPDFAEAIRSPSPTRWPRTADEASPSYRAFVGRGYYGEQLAHVLELFPAEQVLALDFHRIFDDIEATIGRISDFIGVRRFSQPPALLHERVQPSVLQGVPPNAADVTLLVERYAADLATFAEVSGLDISAWPTSRVLGGTLTAGDLAAGLAAKATFTTEDTADAERRRRRQIRSRRRRRARR